MASFHYTYSTSSILRPNPSHLQSDDDCSCCNCLCGSCCFCCKCLSSCCCFCCISIFGCCEYVLNVICNFIVVAAIFAFFSWLIIHPNYVKFTVTDASLTQFNFKNNITLHYDLALNITIRNPNRRVGIYYDNIETFVFYKDVRFGSQTLGTFFQRHKNTSFLSPTFRHKIVHLIFLKKKKK
jgi:hypothetical protein